MEWKTSKFLPPPPPLKEGSSVEKRFTDLHGHLTGPLTVKNSQRMRICGHNKRCLWSSVRNKKGFQKDFVGNVCTATITNIVESKRRPRNYNFSLNVKSSLMQQTSHYTRNPRKPALKTLLVREENRRLETGQFTWFEVPGIRRWTTLHQDIVIITTLAYRM
jgi:hypothetical protein